MKKKTLISLLITLLTFCTLIALAFIVPLCLPKYESVWNYIQFGIIGVDSIGLMVATLIIVGKDKHDDK